MSEPRLYVFDVDGTLVRSFMREGGKAEDYDKIEVLPGRCEAIRRLEREGHHVAIASNQGGVAFGYQTLRQVTGKMADVVARLGLRPRWIRLGPGLGVDSYGNPLDSDLMLRAAVPVVYLSVNHPHAKIQTFKSPDGDDWRKPGGGMLRQAMLDRDVPTSSSAYVGDMETDREAAAAAGIAFHWAEDFFS